MKKQRLSVEIPIHINNKLNKIPWGMKSQVFRVLAENVAVLIGEDLGNALKIISGDIRLTRES